MNPGTRGANPIDRLPWADIKFLCNAIVAQTGSVGEMCFDALQMSHQGLCGFNIYLSGLAGPSNQQNLNHIIPSDLL